MIECDKSKKTKRGNNKQKYEILEILHRIIILESTMKPLKLQVNSSTSGGREIVKCYTLHLRLLKQGDEKGL